MTTLETHEQRRLDICEGRIRRGLATFVDVGKALTEIRDDRLYRETHGTFEAYCEEQWSLSRPRAYQLIEAADVSTTVDIQNERQARELGRVPEEDRADVWREANERVRPATAAAIRDVRNERYPEPPGADPTTPPSDQTPRAQDELPDEATSPVEGEGAPAPSAAPTRDLGDVLEERKPGTRADMQRTALSARWSKLMHAVAEFDLMDMDEVRSAIDDTEASLAVKTLRGVAERLERSGKPGLRVVGGTDA